MKSRFFLSLVTILSIALFGMALRAIEAWQAGNEADAVSSATKQSEYGGKDYNTFLNGFRLPASDTEKEVVTLHLGNDVYVILTNTATLGGSVLNENMGRRPGAAVSLTVPYNASDAVYLEHLQEMAGRLGELGYTVSLQPFDPLRFRSRVHFGHFDIILLGKRSLS